MYRIFVYLTEDKKMRYYLLDALRGFALINMIAYHGIWDLVHIFGMDWKWYLSEGAYVWQQGICWTFILLSGFCWAMGRKKWKRGMFVFGAGLAVTAATLLFMPQDRVIFGVLTLLGSCMLLWIFLSRILERIPAWLGLLGSFGLFIVTRGVNQGYLGFERWKILDLPRSWYRNLVTAFLGFPESDFYSADYFPLLPWIFLFGTGYFFYRLSVKRGWLPDRTGAIPGGQDDRRTFSSLLVRVRLRPLEWAGRHSLILYLAHQPVIYGLLQLFFH